MIPLRDDNPRRTVPVVTYGLIALNILAFLWELSLGPRLDEALFSLAFIPARYWIPGNWIFDLMTIGISMFLHGGFMHIGSNMLYLYIFGDNIEDRLGHGRYLAFYLLCGIAATMAHALFSPTSQIPGHWRFRSHRRGPGSLPAALSPRTGHDSSPHLLRHHHS